MHNANYTASAISLTVVVRSNTKHSDVIFDHTNDVDKQFII